MGKDVVYNGILLSHKKNEIMPFAAAEIELEIMLSEVSWIQKGKYMILLIYGILKKIIQTNLFSKQK